MCHDWYDEDGAQWNFLRDVETNSSCPCVENQAIYDLGRFMPHPRCSQVFRDITCTSTIGSKNCYMSASNIYGSYVGRGGYGYGYASEQTRYRSRWWLCIYPFILADSPLITAKYAATTKRAS
jgi:hypothetical protein